MFQKYILLVFNIVNNFVGRSVNHTINYSSKIIHLKFMIFEAFKLILININHFIKVKIYFKK